MDEARDDILAFTAFPRETWRQIWSNNPHKQLNKEIRRRHTYVVGIFPPWRPSSVPRTVVTERHDEWIEARRYLGLEVPLDGVTAPAQLWRSSAVIGPRAF